MKLLFRIILTVLLLSSIGLLSTVAATATGSARIDEPTRLAVLSGVVEIRGSALLDGSTPLSFRYYRLEYNRAIENGTIPVSSAAYDVQVRGGLLDTWDTTRVPNGTYELRLQVVGPRGVISEARTLVIVDNQARWFRNGGQKVAGAGTAPGREG